MNAGLRGEHYTGSAWQPTTRGMARLAAQDEIDSARLARICGTRSSRGIPLPVSVTAKVEAPSLPCSGCGHPLRPGVRSEFCGMDCRKRHLRRAGLMGRGISTPYSAMATHGLRVKMGILSKRIRAGVNVNSARTQLGQVHAELRRRAGG